MVVGIFFVIGFYVDDCYDYFGWYVGVLLYVI